MLSFLFFCFAGVAVLSAVGVVLLPNPVYSVLSLILTFFVSSAVFIMLGAELVAMLLVIVYVGAVAVLFLFVVMMLDISRVGSRHGLVKHYPLGVACMFLFFGCMVYSVFHAKSSAVDGSGSGFGSVDNVFLIGLQLYTEYAYAFQLAGVLLLIAGVGSLILIVGGSSGRSLKQDVGQQVGRSSRIKLLSPEVGVGVSDAD
ncbi:NADH dehydrogenase subunit J [Anaplasma marginale str. Dawn]|uniref:NADH-quinone oxidoreductase subunit J n=2 Tax=Anaplasma marginale TaxID=770 RepID=B9KIU0_ANAMF|nr:NADH-quinone oxidoreductase subunit J [Anaplasma marginale]AAV86696.1 NADH dehydrogenase chain J [Anaplasma marginale str. St. Maries]ACM49402.1 NADH dehydrogenase I chain J (nuoJ) [Anaplasma marginale str. Florida]AGZ78925.1 NADH dehydrogenase subunit J [Anaplasma marginale str. Gypsy Plains]AGZ79752.1 NADH dehydrogenase subunit J [Anaplasma marginale str. Dawn]AXW84131.1 NADH-quinone oxidoreductase subunit J [Anaplasma marginale]